MKRALLALGLSLFTIASAVSCSEAETQPTPDAVDASADATEPPYFDAGMRPDSTGTGDAQGDRTVTEAGGDAEAGRDGQTTDGAGDGQADGGGDARTDTGVDAGPTCTASSVSTDAGTGCAGRDGGCPLLVVDTAGQVYAMTANGQTLATYASPVANPRGVVHDPAGDGFWVSSSNATFARVAWNGSLVSCVQYAGNVNGTARGLAYSDGFTKTLNFVSLDQSSAGRGRLREARMAFELPNSGNSTTFFLTQTSDDYFDAARFLSTPSTIRVSNANATVEFGEASHGPNTSGKTVWFEWTPDVGGTTTFDTNGSGFDTFLAVYTGTSVDALTLVGSNDNAPGDASAGSSRVSFTAVANTSYFIVVDGMNNASGQIVLNLNGGGAEPPQQVFWGSTEDSNGDEWFTREDGIIQDLLDNNEINLPGGIEPGGLAAKGTGFLVVDRAQKQLVEVSNAGAQINAFALPGTSPVDVSYRP